MPLYEYKCMSCKWQIEEIKPHEERDQLRPCKCGYIMHRLISKSNFQLKGTGWYETDYKKKT